VDRLLCSQDQNPLFQTCGREPNLLCWEQEEVQIIESLKQSLITGSPCIGLTFPREGTFVNIDKGTALGVLTQEHRGKKKPVAYLSKFLAL
jgi:hypothetical protein